MRDPIFIVAPPRSGGALLVEALRSSPDVAVRQAAVESAIAARCGESDRLTAADATPEVAAALRAELASDARLLDASPRHALRVPFLHAVFPGATFVYVYRDPGLELARRWSAITSLLLDDLEKLPPEAWMIAAYRDVIERPETAIARIAEFLGIRWDGSLPDEITRKVAERARDLFAHPPPRAQKEEPAAAFRSISTQSYPELLRRLGISLVVSTYQSGRLILVRAESATTLNTHFRMFRSPMGVAVGNGRIAVGTEREIWDYRNMPAVAAKLDPPGKHDACYVPRKVHITGDIRIHEIGFVSGELWMGNTRFSALCTLDADSTFVPRWRPPFVTQLAPEDRCHLNGMAIIDDRVRFVTALGATDTAGGWRENKAHGGLLLDVDSGQSVLRGLSMPHSPRQYDGRFYILESGKGTFATADLKTGGVETIAELPGFTRGLAFAGPFAFIGLSQVRESNIFGGIPLTERVAERECGVYAVDLRTGRIAAFLRFEGDVREIFDVQVLPGTVYPELLEPTDPLVATSFSVPDEVLSQFSS